MQKKLKLHTDPKVKSVFQNYPPKVRKKLKLLRSLIIDTANEVDTISEMEETLKWGEPSYLVKKGSTIRIDWKSKKPDQYAMYFKCTSKLVPSFQSVYGNLFQYEKTRAIVFNLEEQVPEVELKKCIQSALTYHRVKHLPDLGINQ